MASDLHRLICEANLRAADGGQPVVHLRELWALVDEIKKQEMEAWNGAADLSLDDEARGYNQGQAHALCRVLGDQELLFRLRPEA